MLVSEDRMTEGDGLLLSHAEQGLSWQLNGAFKRLGRRTLSLNPESPPLGIQEFRGLFLIPSPELGLNRPLSPATIQELQRAALEVHSRNAELHLVSILPHSSSIETVESFRTLTPKSTVFVVPTLFGFRDGGLMQAALHQLRENPAALLQNLPQSTPPSVELAFEGDLAGLLISVVGNARLHGKTLVVPGTKHAPQDWLKLFNQHFQPSAPWLDRVRTTFKGLTPAEAFWKTRYQSAEPSESVRQDWPHGIPAMDLFPTVQTPLSRALESCAEKHRRHPELELIFPPGRAP